MKEIYLNHNLNPTLNRFLKVRLLKSYFNEARLKMTIKPTKLSLITPPHFSIFEN